MSRRPSLAGLVSLALIACGVGYLLLRVPRESALRTGGAAPAASTDASSVTPPSIGQGGAFAAPVREASDVTEALISGRVRSEAGSPIEGARVVWLLHCPEDTEETPPNPGGGWGRLARPSVETVTDADGRFLFADPPQGPRLYGALLIASHVGFTPRGLELGVNEEGARGLEIVLQPGRTVEVLVRDEHGAPVGGALVNQVGAAIHRGAPADFEQFFQDSVATDTEGRASLCPLAGEQAIWAELGERASVPWQGVHPERVELQLGDSFTVGGSLTCDRTNWGDYQGERRIVVSERLGNLWMPVVRARGILDGKFGPFRVPLGKGDLIEVRVEGIPIAPLSERFAPPAPGSHREFTFHGKKDACQQMFKVTGLAGEVLPGAQVVAWWDQPTPDAGPRVVRGSSRPDGTIYVGTFPEGRLFYEVSAPGFASFSQDMMVPDEDGVIVTLKPGGRVAGRVLSDSRAVEAFQVICWKPGAIRQNRSSFHIGREDGRFELDGFDSGEWLFQAASPEYPPSSIVSVVAAPGAVSEVELRLAPGLPGGGRVVDRSSGDPIGDAEIEVLGSGGMEAGLPWLPPMRCQADGTFELEAFSVGSNFVRVRAQGYAESVIKQSSSGTFVDFGEIRLARPQILEVRLTALEGSGKEASSFHASAAIGHTLPYTAFDRDGVVRFEDVPPCDLQLVVHESATSWARLQLPLHSGKSWSYEHKAAGGRELEIVLLEDGEPELDPRGLYVQSIEPSGIVTLRSTAPQDGVYRFEGIGAEAVQVWVIEGGQTVVSANLDLGGEDRIRREIPLSKDALRVRVVDDEGQVIVGAWVTLRESGASGIFGADDTDSQGWAELAGAPHVPMLADVHHGIAGWRFGVPIDARVREQDFVLVAAGSIVLRVTDGAAPLTSVTTRIETPGGAGQTRPRDTSGDGTVRYDPLGEGRYRIVGRRSDCWPVVADIALTAGEHATPTVRMRRLAELELVVRSAEGTPLVGVEVELRSLEFDASVADWVAQAAVEGELRTDKDGKLWLKGLPSGPYSWSVSAPVAGGGALELAPGANALDVGRGL